MKLLSLKFSVCTNAEMYRSKSNSLVYLQAQTSAGRLQAGLGVEENWYPLSSAEFPEEITDI